MNSNSVSVEDHDIVGNAFWINLSDKKNNLDYIPYSINAILKPNLPNNSLSSYLQQFYIRQILCEHLFCRLPGLSEAQ